MACGGSEAGYSKSRTSLAPHHPLSVGIASTQYHRVSPQLGLYRYVHRHIGTSRSTRTRLATSGASNETSLHVLGTALAEDALSVWSGHLRR